MHADSRGSGIQVHVHVCVAGCQTVSVVHNTYPAVCQGSLQEERLTLSRYVMASMVRSSRP